jgi:hypothetical protein
MVVMATWCDGRATWRCGGAMWRDGRASSTMVVVEDRGLRVVYDAQIERQQMPTLNLGLINRIPFHLLVRARYLYIYI